MWNVPGLLGFPTPPGLWLRITVDSKTYKLEASTGSRPCASKGCETQAMSTRNLQCLGGEGWKEASKIAREETGRGA